MNKIIKHIVTKTFTYDRVTFHKGCVLSCIFYQGKVITSVNIDTLNKISFTSSVITQLNRCFYTAFLIVFGTDCLYPFRKDTGYCISRYYFNKYTNVVNNNYI